MNTCPCLIADKPCQERCSCIVPTSSSGCLCCAAYGSDEQRKERANRIVEACKSIADKNYFLLLAGINFYNDKIGGWISTHKTFELAEEQVKKAGKYKGAAVSRDYIINSQEYDWYKIVDLRDWIEK